MTTRRQESFPAALRIRKRREYKAIYAEGVRVPGRLMVVFAVPNERGEPRLGITATRRVGSAVRRNRAKRLVREVFRRHRAELGARDMVVNVRASMVEAGYAEVEKDLMRIARRIEGQLPGGAPRPGGERAR